jgi:DNA-binding XRE family transcriptional regulator
LPHDGPRLHLQGGRSDSCRLGTTRLLAGAAWWRGPGAWLIEKIQIPADRVFDWPAKRAYELGQAVRARRLELGMSQTELAERAGMTQSAVSRLEAGGTVPTIGVLERLATALSADLVVTLAPKAA